MRDFANSPEPADFCHQLNNCVPFLAAVQPTAKGALTDFRGNLLHRVQIRHGTCCEKKISAETLPWRNQIPQADQWNYKTLRVRGGINESETSKVVNLASRFTTLRYWKFSFHFWVLADRYVVIWERKHLPSSQLLVACITMYMHSVSRGNKLRWPHQSYKPRIIFI